MADGKPSLFSHDGRVDVEEVEKKNKEKSLVSRPQGTYSNESSSSAKVSFFVLGKGERNPIRQFTAICLPIGEKLYAFGCMGLCKAKLKLSQVLLGGENFLPPAEKLKVFSVNQPN